MSRTNWNLPSQGAPRNRHSPCRRGLRPRERALRIPSLRPTWRKDCRHSGETGKNPPPLRIPARSRTGATPHRVHFPNRKAIRANRPTDLQAGWAILYRALLGASGRGNAELRRIASNHGDAGKATFEALEVEPRPSPSRWAKRRLFPRESAQNARPGGQDPAARGAAKKTFRPSRRRTW